MERSGDRMRESASVDIFDLIKRLIIEWRAILLFAAIAGALVFLVFQQREARKATQQAEQQRAAAEQAQAEALSTEESLRAGLTEEELNAVLLAVQQSKLINARTDYLVNSPWLQEGVSSQKYSYNLLRLQGAGLEGTFLKRYYSAYLLSNDFLKVVAGASFSEEDLAYAGDMVAWDLMISGQDEEPGEPAVMSMIVMIPAAEDAEAMHEKIKKAITDYSVKLSGQIGEHTVSFDQSEVRTRLDQSPANRRRELQYELYNTKAQLKAVMDVFTSRQRMLYDKMMGEITEEELTTASTGTVRSYGKGAFAAGALLAVFLYLCAAILIVIVKAKVNSPKELPGIFCLGEYRDYHAKNVLDAFVRSRLFYRGLYKEHSSREDALRLTKDVLKTRKDKSVVLVMAGEATPAMNEAAAGLEAWGSTAGVAVRKRSLKEASGTAAGAEEGTCAPLILLVSAGSAAYTDIRKYTEVTSLLGEQILGYILCGA